MRTPRVKSKLTVTVELIQLDEDEVRALDALAGYGTDPFIQAFYKVMGKCYLGPHEDGLRSFLDGIRPVCQEAIGRVDAAHRELKSEQKRGRR